jgi:diguanylate cyclase (GGDEF)-like protein
VGRYGGDEFLIILKSSSREAAETYRQVVTSSLRDSTIFDRTTGDPIAVRMSIGIAMFPADASTIEALIPLSDAAMYATKGQCPASRTTGQVSYLRPVDGTQVPSKSIAA